MRSLLLGALLLVTAACGDRGAPQTDAGVRTGITESERFTAWLDNEYAEQLDFSPLAKTRLGDKSDLGELDDVSEAALAAELQWRRDSVARMRAEFDREALDPQGQTSWDLWEYELQDEERNAPFQRHRFIFGRNGPQSALPASFINYQIVESAADMRAYISRLQQSRRYLQQYLERAQRAAADGIRAPYFDYDRALREAGSVISGAPFDARGDSPIWADITAKIDGLVQSGAIDGAVADELTVAARSALLTSFKPGYEEIQAWLRADRDNVPAVAQGAWSLPNGDEFYGVRLRTMTTLPLTAAEIHELGLSEVARIQDEMQGIRAQVGFAGTLQEFFEFMRTDEQFYYPNTDQGRADYLALADELLAATYAKLPDYFGILPRAGLQVKREEAFREQAGGAAHYTRGAPDGSRPGTFYVHLADMRAVAVNRLENLAYHEGVPGHHMQRSIQQELEGIPRFRTQIGYTAFTEGWGLYAELLGKEMGGYQDPYADFGRLSGEIWRAVRLVVDTGIHALRWSEEEAVAYALANSSRPEQSVRAEIERYFNNPAQATSYKIGMIKILELRARAQAELGAAFDIRAFHDLVLGSGPLPLALLERQVERWIASRKV